MEKINTKKGFHAILFDVSLFPSHYNLSINYNERYATGSIEADDTMIRFEDIKGVWWRRPLGQFKPVKSPLQSYINTESEIVTRSLYQFLKPPHCNWISLPDQTRSGARKPEQLRIAQEIGFDVPLSCISNSSRVVSEFIQNLNGKDLAIKPAASSFINLHPNSNKDIDGNKVVFTQRVDPQLILENIDLIGNCPVIYQEAVEKIADVRVTVVDESVFPVIITTNQKSDDKENLDWRNYKYERTFERHSMPKKIDDFCIKIIKGLDLRFGCIDLALTKDKEYIFFEVNPQGQWLNFEELLGYNISGSIAQALCM
jgi:glutathione synthase/RimK-type ligase-like ATP-grasp enzyme